MVEGLTEYAFLQGWAKHDHLQQN